LKPPTPPAHISPLQNSSLPSESQSTSMCTLTLLHLAVLACSRRSSGSSGHAERTCGDDESDVCPLPRLFFLAAKRWGLQAVKSISSEDEILPSFPAYDHAETVRLSMSPSSFQSSSHRTAQDSPQEEYFWNAGAFDSLGRTALVNNLILEICFTVNQVFYCSSKI
jgi:hypothetical protein